MNNEARQYTIMATSDLNALFMELFKLFLNMRSHITVTLWGKLPRNVLACLEKYESSSKTMRARIMREHEFIVYRPEADNFANSIQSLKLDKYQWGILLDDAGVVLARDRNDITINDETSALGDRIPRLLERLLAEGIIGRYEVVDEESSDKRKDTELSSNKSS